MAGLEAGGIVLYAFMVIDGNIDEWWQGLLELGWLDTEPDFAVLKAFAFYGVERATFEGCKIWLLPLPSSVSRTRG